MAQPDRGAALYRDYRLALLRMASRYTSDQHRIQDLAQEGAIAIWQASQTETPRGTSRNTYLLNSAHWRMARCVERRTWTGLESRRGSALLPRGSEGLAGTAGGVEAISGGFPAPSVDASLARHRPEIVAAIKGLSPRTQRLLFRRFWLDEVVPTGGWWSDPTYGAKAVLAERLKHLRGMA